MENWTGLPAFSEKAEELVEHIVSKQCHHRLGGRSILRYGKIVFWAPETLLKKWRDLCTQLVIEIREGMDQDQKMSARRRQLWSTWACACSYWNIIGIRDR